jgi:tetratricopeptide (TPR) repeat protein
MTHATRRLVGLTLAGLLTCLTGGATAQEKLTPEERTQLEKEAATLNLVGLLAYQQGKLKDALPALTRALALRERLYPDQDHLALASSLTNLGSVLSALGQADKALPFIERGLKMREALFKDQDHPDLATSLNNMGVVLKALGQPDKALPYYERALAMRQRLCKDQDHPLLALSLYNMGSVLTALGQPDKALPFFERALTMRERLFKDQDHPHLAQSLNNMGYILKALGQADRALPYFERALKMNERLCKDQDHPELVLSLNNMGSVLSALGQANKALPFYERALKMSERLYKDQDHPDLANSLNHMGFVLSALGQPDKAVPFFERALTMRERLFKGQDHPDLAGMLDNMGAVLKALGQADKALPYHERALKMYERLFKDRDHPDLATSLNNMGYILNALGQADRALPYFERALKMNERLFKNQDHPLLANGLNNLGGILNALGQLDRALPFFERALKMRERLFKDQDHPALAESLTIMGTVLTALGQADKALPFFERALKMNARLVQREAANLSEQAALDFLHTLPDSRSQYLVLTRKEATSAVSVTGVLWTSRAVVTRLLEQRHFATQETDQVRGLRLRLAELRALLTVALQRPVTDPQRDKLLRELTDEKEQLERQLLQALPSRLREADKSKPEDLLAVLPAGCVFLDILRYQHRERDTKPEARYVAFVYTSKGQVARVELDEARPIDEAANGWREAVLRWTLPNVNDTFRTDRERDAARHAATLRQRVWDKIAPHLPQETTTIYHSVEGDLGRFPLAALPGDKEGILLEKYAFASVLHGPALLEALRQPADADDGSGKVLVLGGLDYGPGETWKALPGSAREREQLGKLAPDRLLASLTGTEASVPRLLETLPQVRYAHLATHGQFREDLFTADQEKAQRFRKDLRDYTLGSGGPERVGLGTRNPLAYVGLVLSGANQPDKAGPAGGILSGESIVGLQLEKLKLVVLSACETGLGANTDTEGVRGLQRAFHLAGCPNVVASLWQVDDQATAALMNAFWERVLVQKLPPVQALHEAQLLVYRRPDLVGVLASRAAPNFQKAVDVNPQKAEPEKLAEGGRSLRHPYFWAGFFLSGAGR